MTSVSADQIILTQTQPVGSGRPPGTEPGVCSPRFARSTDWATAPPCGEDRQNETEIERQRDGGRERVTDRQTATDRQTDRQRH